MPREDEPKHSEETTSTDQLTEAERARRFPVASANSIILAGTPDTPESTRRRFQKLREQHARDERNNPSVLRSTHQWNPQTRPPRY